MDVQSIDGASDVLSEVDFESDLALPTHPHCCRAPSALLSGVASDTDANAETRSVLGSSTDVDSGASDFD